MVAIKEVSAYRCVVVRQCGGGVDLRRRRRKAPPERATHEPMAHRHSIPFSLSAHCNGFPSLSRCDAKEQQCMRKGAWNVVGALIGHHFDGRCRGKRAPDEKKEASVHGPDCARKGLPGREKKGGNEQVAPGKKDRERRGPYARSAPTNNATATTRQRFFFVLLCRACAKRKKDRESRSGCVFPSTSPFRPASPCVWLCAPPALLSPAAHTVDRRHVHVFQDEKKRPLGHAKHRPRARAVCHTRHR